MSRAYIYMEHPQTGEVVTLGRLTLQGKVGEFLYAPDYVASNGWVPDPINYPLRAEAYTGITKNRGIPGFINDAMPDGWGERLLHRAYGQELTTLDFLLKSPNNDRIGNLMVGRSASPAPGLGSEPAPTLRGLAKFVEACEAVYDSQLDQESVSILNLRQQRSSLGGARPKRTLQDHGMLILAKPRDRFDQYDLPAVEYACMTFAASKGLNVARTALHAETPSTLLVERFDRTPLAEGGSRLPMLSALTLLDAEWMTQHDWRYAGVADEMRRRGVPDKDLQELFKRMCYNALVGNSDDHPRNHAIIWTAGQWRLSPMYDVLPILDEGPAQTLAMAVGREGAQISRRNLLSHHEHFALAREQAEQVLDEVIGWEQELKEYYGRWLQGAELQMAQEATSAARMR
ncbi:type II toxin-antitoxin system HipA family toxin [Pseudomonas gingeri]|uniref:type II toxin-antitoxin system HipA family toxin n=1 Tax=Pseudomonas TaxID=286 RepID=UPI0015A46EEF|nr:type II toxin-antitoxin system HipA family toxin [Pseudomonas gingeri]NWE45687.1 type II toxin-antitoxin system HipA family toxin [Pseudomonas gingeri]NWE67128.1 type II toxin-antitoxin system HipA family toxin [Pseudomonas gingeri]